MQNSEKKKKRTNIMRKNTPVEFYLVYIQVIKNIN